MSIESLRALVESYDPELTYPIVLDRGLKLRIMEASGDLVTLRQRRASLAGASPEDRAVVAVQTLADAAPHFPVDDEIAAAEAALTSAEDEARPSSMVLVFGICPSEGDASFAAHRERHTGKGGVTNIVELGAALLAASYRRTESPSGEDVGLTWEQARKPLDDGDLEALRVQIIGHNRVGASIPFDPRPSGKHAMS